MKSTAPKSPYYCSLSSKKGKRIFYSGKIHEQDPISSSKRSTPQPPLRPVEQNLKVEAEDPEILCLDDDDNLEVFGNRKTSDEASTGRKINRKNSQHEHGNAKASKEKHKRRNLSKRKGRNIFSSPKRDTVEHQKDQIHKNQRSKSPRKSKRSKSPNVSRKRSRSPRRSKSTSKTKKPKAFEDLSAEAKEAFKEGVKLATLQLAHQQAPGPSQAFSGISAEEAFKQGVQLATQQLAHQHVAQQHVVSRSFQSSSTIANPVLMTQNMGQPAYNRAGAPPQPMFNQGLMPNIPNEDISLPNYQTMNRPLRSEYRPTVENLQQASSTYPNRNAGDWRTNYHGDP